LLVLLTRPLRDGQEHSLPVVLVAVVAALLALFIIDLIGVGVLELVLAPLRRVLPQSLGRTLDRHVGGPILLTGILTVLVLLFVLILFR
jgi:hypothetical protein